VLLLSRDHAYSYLNKFVVAEVTTTIRNIAVQVPQQIACEGPALQLRQLADGFADLAHRTDFSAARAAWLR